jgi:hypothetical protein
MCTIESRINQNPLEEKPTKQLLRCYLFPARHYFSPGRIENQGARIASEKENGAGNSGSAFISAAGQTAGSAACSAFCSFPGAAVHPV